MKKMENLLTAGLARIEGVLDGDRAAF